jgi:uncharacterized SAM-binding protein YcdF (DUF218 family)
VSRPLSGHRIATIILRVIAIGTMAAVIAGAYATYRIVETGAQDDRSTADAIVVMGAAQYDGRPSPIFAARLDHAIGLYRAGVAPRLIVTGGKAEGDRTTEAASARAYAVQRGIPDDAILAEDDSRTTLGSVRGVAGLLREAGLRTAVFVSDRPHMLRVLRMADDAGIDAHGSPTTTSPLDGDIPATVDAVIHELGGLVVYLAGDGPP